MARELIVGIDSGTSVVKAVAFDLAGRQIAVAGVANRYERVGAARVEQDLEATWRDAAATLHDLARQVPDLAARVAAIAVTGQGDGTWLVDADGRPVGRALLWLDARATRIAEALRSDQADAARFAATGTGLAACQQGAQLAWLDRHQPEALAASATAFHCKDWLYFRLTGERATDVSEAVLTFGDFRTRDYSDAVLDALGLARHARLLPPIVDGARHRSRLSADGARTIGLAAGTPVVLGAIDIVCSALGAGLLDRNADAGCSILGSTGLHMRLARSHFDVRLAPDRTGYTICVPNGDACLQLQSNLAATLNIDWVLDLIAGVLAADGIAPSRRSLIERIDAIVASASPGAVLFHPYIADGGERGPFVDGAAHAGFYGLRSGHGHADLVRAVVEGLAFAARDCYEAMGPIPDEIRLSGGAARSPALRAVLAAALGRAVRPSRREEVGAAGAAMIAAVSLGLHRDLAECADAWARPLLGEPEPPDAVLAARYDDLFPIYRAAREAMAPVWRRLADHRERVGG
ncbi:MAG: FGGY family carbohydrate kinase [Alphaproteobacteria bacterium]